MKFMIYIKFLLNWLITHFSNSVKIFHSIIAMKYIEIDLLISSMFIGPCLITLVLIWDARTRHPGQCTRVRRGGTRRQERDAADRASVPCRASWRFPNRADAAEISADAAQIGPTRSVSACIGRNG